ncbi:CPA_1a_G0034780.mRNA.1.CDS.1 [Saccharomyces cerevisiae]|nr:CPA_1a_G0034780.mRNA.1.CDS.1 [Saccharomyces cerevisiae]CAI7399100.1 CPA_1a_G0034780.mRNA.1.CDS.1 [Saccharomyces cerevisiae]
MVTFLLYTGYNGQMIYSVQFFQLIFASSAWKAGLHLIPIIITNVIAAIASGVITKKLGLVKPLLIFGGVLGVIGAGLMTLMTNTSTKSTQIGVLLLPGFSLGFALQASLMSAQLQITKDRPEAAMDFIEVTAFNTFMKSLGTTLGGVLSTTVFSASFHNKVSRAHLEPYEGKTVDDMILYRLQNYDGSHSTIGNILSDSIKNVFWMDLGFYALGFLFCSFSSNKKLIIPKKDETPEDNLEDK